MSTINNYALINLDNFKKTKENNLAKIQEIETKHKEMQTLYDQLLNSNKFLDQLIAEIEQLKSQGEANGGSQEIQST